MSREVANYTSFLRRRMISGWVAEGIPDNHDDRSIGSTRGTMGRPPRPPEAEHPY